MRLRILALILVAAATASCGGDQVVPVDATPDADMTDALDLDPPDTIIDSGPMALTNQAPARFEFHASENATFKCTVDGGAETMCTSPKMITGLTDGPHTFSVKAIDSSHNEDPTPATFSWRIDTQPPETEILSGPPPVDNSTSVRIEFDAPGEVGATFTCTLDGIQAACTSPFTADSLTDGNHTFRVQAKDAAGNFDSTPALLNWQIDSISPDTVIDTGPAGSVNQTTATFTFSSPGADAGARFDCHLDTAPFGPCTSPRDFVGLTDGQHVFEVRVTDSLGNTDPTPARRTWTIDSTGPITSITTRPENPSAVLRPMFVFSANEMATFECQIDGIQMYAPCTSPFMPDADLPIGSRFIRIRATDLLGNRGPEATYEWVIDHTGPVVTITSGPNGPTASSTATFGWNSSEPATFCYRFAGDAQDTCTNQLAGSGTVTRPGLMQGAQTFTITATDALGNAGLPTVRNFTVDTVGPAVTIMAGPMNTVGTLANAFTFTSPEVATYCYKVDTAGELCTPLPGAMSATVTVNAIDGAHTLTVVARDALGNRTAMAATRSWTIDTVRPTTTIMTGPVQNSILGTGDAPITLTASEASTICWKINAGAETCSQAGVMTFDAGQMALPDGLITFTARSKDAIDFGPSVTRVWTVDTVRPTVMITAGPASMSTVGNAQTTFTVTSSEPSQICWTFNALAQQCSPTGVVTFSPSAAQLPDGASTFSVFAKDAIGDGMMVSRTWTIDTVRPTITIMTGPAAGSTQGTNIATFNVNSSEAATICWRFNGGAESCSAAGSMMATAMSAALPDGGTSFSVYGKDTVGAGAILVRNWTIDTARPTVTITSGPAQGSAVGANNASFQLVASERSTICWQFNGAAATCAAPGQTIATASAINLPEGNTTFSVTAADAVGAGVATTRNWTVDTVRPTMSITAGPAAGATINAVAATVSVASTEPATICWRLDGGVPTCTAAGQNSTDIMLAALGQGDHTISITGADLVGVGAALSRSFIVDTVRPTVTITAGPAQGSTINSTTANFTVTSSEASQICWKFNGGMESCSATGVTLAAPSANGLGQGANQLDVRAIDGVGTGVTLTRNWTVDTVRPTVTITAGPPQGSIQGSKFAQFTVTSSEPSQICWRFTHDDIPTCSATGQVMVMITSNPLGDGPNVFSVDARDAVGPGAAVLRGWSVDTARPMVTVNNALDPAEGAVLDNSTVTFHLTASEPSQLCWSFNGDGPTCSAPGQTTALATAVGLPDGPVTFTASAADVVGPGPMITRHFAIDTTPPMLTISSPPAEGGSTNSVNQNFTFMTNEESTICWKLDAGAQTCSAAHVMMFNASLMNLSEGNHTLAVQVTDNVANQATTLRHWTIDLTPPNVTIGTPPAQNGYSNDVNPTLAITSDEAATICWQLDAGAQTCSAAGSVSLNAVLSMLGAGNHTLTATAQDAATNTGMASRTWTIDVTAPMVGISMPPAEGATDNVDHYTFTLTTDEPSTICWKLDPVGAQTCSAAGVMSTMTDNLAISVGNHDLAVTATDRAGNVTLADRHWTRAVARLTPPRLGGATGAPGAVHDGHVSFWVRDPGLAGGDIVNLQLGRTSCRLHGVQALVALECTDGDQELAPAYGGLGALAKSDGAWHLVSIELAGDRAELWIDGALVDRTGEARASLGANGIGAAPGVGTYAVDGLVIRSR